MIQQVEVLVIDDEYKFRKDMIEEAAKAQNSRIFNYSFTYYDSFSAIPAGDLNRFKIILLDWGFPDGQLQGYQVLKELRKVRQFSGYIILFTQKIERQAFENCFDDKEGANDYHCIAYGADTLINTMNRLLSQALPREWGEVSYDYIKDFNVYTYHQFATKKDNVEKTQQTKKLLTTEWSLTYDNKLKSTGSMGDVILMIEKLADKDVPVLILGDTGTGKELVARLLHYHHKSKRRENSFLDLNCGALSPELLDGELFGTLPGAFTDAVEKAGVFEQVTVYNDKGSSISGGTVFLDEIGLMDFQSQAFLLRVLQEQKVRRLGYDLKKAKQKANYVKTEGQEIKKEYYGDIPVNFRLVAATNEDLIQNVLDKEFRLDLFFRIGYAIIRIPRLTERHQNDFNLLFQFFLKKYSDAYGKRIEINEGDKLKQETANLIHYLWTAFPWMGNVRELESVVHTMVAFCEDGDELNIKNIPPAFYEVSRRLGFKE